MNDVIIIGNGIGGSSLAREFRSRGLEVLVVSVGPGGSEASLAITRPTYLKRADRALLEPAMLELERVGAEVVRGAFVTSYLRPDEAPRHQKDWRAISPLDALVEADLPGWANAVDAHSVEVDRKTYTARLAVIWCDGEGPGVRNYGVTWIHPDPYALNMLPHELLVHHTAPYKTIAAVSFADGVRLGSSSDPDAGKAMEKARVMFARAVDLGWVKEPKSKGWTFLGGCRVNRDTFLDHHPSGAWRFGGFHRSGYSIAPAIAREIASEILETEYLTS